MRDIVSIIINVVVMAFIVYGFVITGGKLSTFGIIINTAAIIAVIASTYINIKNLKKRI
ncbi:hypothetical protein [Clostridium sp. OS1-26]|uniref:hypothetical protein n=1 Tax=Clostridium sp. OS1-26 TaxID=3070681 RepID=UPI0027E10DB3|nr:hypothetical protein [Clostridium sp. OS1-26]WML33181.1 hypothetical protein RCG18_17730 [Clostridium sp. OS1-26]